MSLKSVYNQMLEQDFEKAAQAQVIEEYGEEFAGADSDMLKTAADYDYIGRILAHNVFEDLVKEAMDEAMPGASAAEKKKEVAKTLAKARGEDTEDDEEEKKEKKDDEKSEKTAAVQQAILERMAEDPDYLQALISKHYG